MKMPHSGLREQFRLKTDLSVEGLKSLVKYKVEKFQGNIEFLKKVLLNEAEIASSEGDEDTIEHVAAQWHVLNTDYKIK